MNFAVGLVIYIIVFFILIWGAQRIRMTMFSGVTVAALISALLLALMVPFHELDQHVDKVIDGEPHKDTLDAIVWTYILIYVLTVVLVTWYVVSKALEEGSCRRSMGGDKRYKCQCY